MSKDLVRGAVIFLKNNTHPFLIVSNNAANKNSHEIIVIGMTSKHKRLDMPTHTIVNFHDSMVMAESMHMVDKEQVRTVAHILNRQSMKKVDDCLRHAIDL